MVLGQERFPLRVAETTARVWSLKLQDNRDGVRYQMLTSLTFACVYVMLFIHEH
jgi:hypothetical protein